MPKKQVNLKKQTKITPLTPADLTEKERKEAAAMLREGYEMSSILDWLNSQRLVATADSLMYGDTANTLPIDSLEQEYATKKYLRDLKSGVVGQERELDSLENLIAKEYGGNVLDAPNRDLMRIEDLRRQLGR